MNVLGIVYGSESGVALFQDGKPTFALSEERLSREKLDDRYPERALAWLMKEARVRPEEIDAVCFGFTNGMEQGGFVAGMIERLGEYADEPGALKVILERLTTEARIDADRRREFEERARAEFPQSSFHFCHHHEAHQAGAFVASPFDRALVLTMDGRGDFKAVTIAEADRTGIRERYHAYSWESLGYFYGRVTKLCGFTPNRHEGKITGLAAHGDPTVARGLMYKMIELKDGKLRSHPGDYYRPFFSQYSETLEKEAAQYSREDLAAAAQAHLEELTCELVRGHLKATGLKHLCVAGGVFANVKLSQRLREMPEVDDIFVLPAMSDGGLCAGAVYFKLFKDGATVEHPVRTLFLGPELDAEDLKTRLERVGVEVHKPADLVGEMCGLLGAGQVIGLATGRHEFGPRALGNRSILATPRDPNQCAKINERLERTEFMPFAPSIASTVAARCLKGYHDDHASSRHMTISYTVTPEFAENAPAVVHVDNTARPQVVHREDNPFYFELLTRFHERTGTLCLLNTSFNVHEEPIVCSAQDVANTFLRGTTDYLAFPPYIAKLPPSYSAPKPDGTGGTSGKEGRGLDHAVGARRSPAARGGGFHAKAGADHGPCVHPWTDACVTAVGRMTCCPQNRTAFGNVRAEDPVALWNGEAAQRVRRLVSDGRYLEAGCDVECPYLRGAATAPATLPPIPELINPDFDVVDDGSDYAKNVAAVIEDYRERREFVTGLPLFVDSQPVLRCNSDCIMCGQPHDSPMVHGKAVAKALAVLKPTANYFRYQGGEVFLDKGFRSELRALAAEPTPPHLKLYVITNGTAVGDRLLRELVVAEKPVFFLVSIDGVRREVYEHVRRKLSYDRAMHSLRTLAALQAVRSERIVVWNYVVMRSTLDDMRAAMDLAAGLGVDLNFAPIQGDFEDENIFLHPELAMGDHPELAQGNLIARLDELAAYASTLTVEVSGFDGLKVRVLRGLAQSCVAAAE